MVIKNHIGVTMEVYINDIVVKVKRRLDHIGNLAETFNVLKEYKLKFNLVKWTFRVYLARFLRYLVTQREIEVHLKQIRAILDMKSQTILMEIQCLIEREIALNWFFLQSVNRCKSFFKVIKKAQTNKWNEECEKSFKYLKQYLISPSLLSNPDLFIYLEVSKAAMSYVVLQEELGTQLLVF